MRTPDFTSQFKRDYKREKKGRHRIVIDAEIFPVITQLLNDKLLDFRYKDHVLIGKWIEHRDCHIKPDLILIYQKIGTDILRLIRLGSHSELGL